MANVSSSKNLCEGLLSCFSKPLELPPLVFSHDGFPVPINFCQLFQKAFLNWFPTLVPLISVHISLTQRQTDHEFLGFIKLLQTTIFLNGKQNINNLHTQIQRLCWNHLSEGHPISSPQVHIFKTFLFRLLHCTYSRLGNSQAFRSALFPVHCLLSWTTLKFHGKDPGGLQLTYMSSQSSWAFSMSSISFVSFFLN